MRKRILLIAMLVVVSALSLSCGPRLPNNYPDAKVSKTDTGNTLIVTDDFIAVILTADFMKTHDIFVPPPGYWTPDVDQILYIESNIGTYLSERPKLFHSGHAPDQETLSTYGRQYHGVVAEDGTRIIYGLFFCPYYQKYYDWKNELVGIISGGGDCVIGVFYYPENGDLGAIAGSLK